MLEKSGSTGNVSKDCGVAHNINTYACTCVYLLTYVLTYLLSYYYQTAVTGDWIHPGSLRLNLQSEAELTAQKLYHGEYLQIIMTHYQLL